MFGRAAQEEHLLVGGMAAALVMFLLAYLLIDILREFNRAAKVRFPARNARSCLCGRAVLQGGEPCHGVSGWKTGRTRVVPELGNRLPSQLSQ